MHVCVCVCVCVCVHVNANIHMLSSIRYIKVHVAPLPGELEADVLKKASPHILVNNGLGKHIYGDMYKTSHLALETIIASRARLLPQHSAEDADMIVVPIPLALGAHLSGQEHDLAAMNGLLEVSRASACVLTWSQRTDAHLLPPFLESHGERRNHSSIPRHEAPPALHVHELCGTEERACPGTGAISRGRTHLPGE